MSELIYLYRPAYLRTIVYMLQSTEYQAWPYLRWYWRTPRYSTVMTRRHLRLTLIAKVLGITLAVGVLLQCSVGFWLMYLGVFRHLAGGVPYGLAVIIAYPILWAHLIVIPLVLGRWFVIKPLEWRQARQAEQIFALHPGIKIAIAGSYGKTSMKEILRVVLGEAMVVAATPGNLNVTRSHARFARSLTGNEKVVLIEYGEGQPGDIARFARMTHPNRGVITGLAPAHLDRYKTLAAAAEDIFSLVNFVDELYVNDTNAAAVADYVTKTTQLYDPKTALGWKISDVDVAITGTSFTMHRGRQSLHLKSGLLGVHSVAFVAFAAALAHELGATADQISAGVAALRPYEHRLQPYQLHGAWVIDDTYNGNLEGIRAGTALLKSLPAKRKLYVTPGLVEQGALSRDVHHEVGRLIADAKPDVVVLMKNSTTAAIEAGLEAAGYGGEVRIETQPLDFYTNLAHFIAAGDIVLMQNDWTDNYA